MCTCASFKDSLIISLRRRAQCFAKISPSHVHQLFCMSQRRRPPASDIAHACEAHIESLIDDGSILCDVKWLVHKWILKCKFLCLLWCRHKKYQYMDMVFIDLNVCTDSHTLTPAVLVATREHFRLSEKWSNSGVSSLWFQILALSLQGQIWEL